MDFCDDVNEPLMTMEFPGKAKYVTGARTAFTAAMNRLDVDPEIQADITLAFGEACNNAVLHGGGSNVSVNCRVQVNPETSVRRLFIDIRNSDGDFAQSDLSQSVEMPPAEVFASCGRGLPLMHILTDRMVVFRDEDATVVRLEKDLI